LKSLLPVGSDVTLRSKATDRYGRSVEEVIRNSTNINQSLVKSGNAFVYWHYIKGCEQQTYSLLEITARQGGMGVWSVSTGDKADREPITGGPFDGQHHAFRPAFIY